MSEERHPDGEATIPASEGGQSAQPTPAPHGRDANADVPDLEPMTFSLLGRFFLVPLVIIGTIVSGAVLVVLLFGGTSAPQERSLAGLLQSLEATSGERSFGILLPREKELWQTALELSVRLKEKEKDPSFTADELADVADRLSVMINADLEALEGFVPADDDRASRRALRSRRLEFLIHALGRTELPEAFTSLLEIVRSGREPFVQVAMQELVELREMPDSQAAVAPITVLLNNATTDETRLVACTALSVLANPGDSIVIEALNATRLLAEGDVSWSAALALARLGSDAGKSTLLDLLDRSFLESGERYHVTAPDGTTVHRYAMPPQRVDEILVATIDAASKLDDEGLWEMIKRLESDSSPMVRGKAVETLKQYGRVADATPYPAEKD